ncbi:MAG: ComEC/Rec2 family competence protein [Acidobacteria bacterium]|nr:ComEC/Rec2 family competence protein [Acidobacteriota bacterium]
MRRRPLVLLALAVLTGNLLAAALILRPAPCLALAILLAALAVRLPRPGRCALLLTAAAAVGAGCRSLPAALRPANHLEKRLARGWLPPAGPILLVGTVRTPAERTPDGYDLHLDLERLGTPGEAVRGRVLLRVPPPADESLLPWPGDRLRVHAALRPVRSFRNAGGFDYRAHLARQGIHLVGRVKSFLLLRPLPGGRRGPFLTLQRWRAGAARRLDRWVQGDADARGLLKAILLGLPREIPEAARATLQASGIYHVVAVSGLHLGALMGVWWFLARRMRVSPRLAAATGLPLLALFVLFFGPSHSVLRAALMALPLLAGRILSRSGDPWNAMGFSLILVVLADGDSPPDAGFQLSYAATAGILLSVRRGDPAGWGFRVFAASAAAQALSLPLTVWHFHRVSPAGLVLNFFAIPASTLLLAAGGPLLLISEAFPPAVGPAGSILRWLARSILAAGRAGAGMPGGSWRLAPPSLAVMGIYYLALGAVSSPLPRRFRRIAAGAWLSTLLVMFGPRPEVRPVPGMRATFLDVGQGDAVLLEFPGPRRLLIDAGGVLGSSFDVGEAVVSPALRHLGAVSLEAVAMTHPHHDHAAGLEAVLQAFPVAEFWNLPDGPTRLERTLRRAAVARGVPGRSLSAGDRIWVGGARLEVLHPPDPLGQASARDNPNEDSLVLRAACGAVSILLTGDIESRGERTILAGGAPSASTILKVAHHGSPDSSSPAFLQAVRPRIAVVSVGGSNPWGHPDPRVIQELRGQRAATFRTDEKGAIAVETDGCFLEVSSRAAGPEIAFPCTVRPEPDRRDPTGEFGSDPE